MPRCLADRYGAASGALGSDGSSVHSTRFSEAGPGMGPAGMERTRQRVRRARLSLVGVDRGVDVSIGELEHGKALESVLRKNLESMLAGRTAGRQTRSHGCRMAPWQ